MWSWIVRLLRRASLKLSPRSERHTTPHPTHGINHLACEVRRSGGIDRLVGAGTAVVRREASSGAAHAATHPSRPVARADAARRLLKGDGIGTITFGQPRSTVLMGLERLLGPPHETIPGICGFGRSTDWIGLNINSHEPNLSAELGLNFQHSRFVGYAYSANAEGPARQRRGILLATTRGLTLGNTVARARHLYGRAFTVTSVPQGTPPSAKLPRLPVGEVSTASGEISAGIEGFGRHGRVGAHSTVVSIGAGAGPNTPCRSRR